MDGIGKVDGQAMPIFANYRFTSILEALPRILMGYWSPDFTMLAEDLAVSCLGR